MTATEHSEQSGERARKPEIGPGAARSSRAAQTGLTRAWAARGFLGGLAACALALFGQYNLTSLRNPDAGAKYYAAGFVLLAVSLLHPSLPARLFRKSAPLGAATEAPMGTAIPQRPARALPTRHVVSAQRPGGSSLPATLRQWRARAGWRATAFGLALSGALAGASALVLNGDTESPLGGWLWTGSLLALLLAVVGVEPAPGRSLLPLPRSDPAGRGLPTLSPRVEAALVALMLLVALALRLWDLEYHPGIFGDEGERGVDARGILQGSPDNIFGFGWWNVPNLYFYAMSWMLRLFGDSTMTGARMLSVISGVLTVWFVYRSGRVLWGPRAGLIAGVLMAVSALALQFSRVAGESTPTGALWAGGFYFFVMALAHRRWSDWMLAGLFWGFSMYFYASGKLIVAVLAALAVYSIVRWRLEFFRRYALGFALTLAAFGVVFMPNAIFSSKESWRGFSSRAAETSIFSPGNQEALFSKYGIQHDPTLVNRPLLQNLAAQPWPWLQAFFQQMRVSVEVFNRTGDPTAMYEIRDHDGTMLPPVWAALALLGLVYGALKVWDPRFGLADIWFWGGMLAPALTTDTPSVQRLVGAWPALMLFPAALLDRIFAAAWPINLTLARRWATVPLAALVLYLGAGQVQEYFVHYRSLCPYCIATLQSRFALSLGQNYRAYNMSIGGDNIYFNYGSTRYLAKGIEGEDVLSPAAIFPITNSGGKGAAFMVYPSNYVYRPLIERFYPGVAPESDKGRDGLEYFVGYKVSRKEMAERQTLHVTYTGGKGERTERDEPSLGPGIGWTSPAGLSYPAEAVWEGTLVAPAYALYSFAASTSAGNVSLRLDDREVPLDGGQVVLAKGPHSVSFHARLRSDRDRPRLTWTAGSNGPGPVPTPLLFNMRAGGFLAEVGQVVSLEQLESGDPFGGLPVVDRRTYPFIGFREATSAFSPNGFTVRWRGTLPVRTAGNYEFDTVSTGPTVVIVDGQVVAVNRREGNVTGAAGNIELAPGDHQVDVRYAFGGGTSSIELYWAPPDGKREILPPWVLKPPAGVWLRGEVPDPPVAEVPMPAAAQAGEAAITLTPGATMGGPAGLLQPRGIGVDAEGNVYVGDRGNHRVVVFSPDGKVLRRWGTAAEAGREKTPQPGEFYDIRDLAVSTDGTVYVMDSNGATQVFDRAGNFLRLSDGSALGMYAPNGIGVDPDGKLVVADTGGSTVLRLAKDGQSVEAELRGSDDAGPQKLDQPLDAASDGKTTYAIDLRKRIVAFDSVGEIESEWPATTGTGDGGSRLALSPDGTLYVTVPESAQVLALDPASSVFGSYIGGGKLASPSGVAVDASGRVYVVDSSNNSVQVFTATRAK